MFTDLEIFKKSWLEESDGTTRVLNNLTNQSLTQKVWEEGRTLGALTWHIVSAVPEMLQTAGLQVDSVPAESDDPNDVTEYQKLYKKYTEMAVELINSNWTNEMLLDEIDMYGEKWTRGYMLDIMLRHQSHHRGQMTVLMRQAGLKVPGVCGPSKEEWEAMINPDAK